jgi:hypothetical protein
VAVSTAVIQPAISEDYIGTGKILGKAPNYSLHCIQLGIKRIKTD